MNTFKKLWQGKYSLPKSFWIFTVLLGSALNLPSAFINIMPARWVANNVEVIVWYWIFVGTYHFVVSVGVWTSSTLYTGNPVWKYLAKGFCILSWAYLLMGIVNIFYIGTIYGFVSLGFLLLSAYVLEKEIEVSTRLDLTKNAVSNSSESIKQNSINQLPIDEALWERASKELLDGKKEGLWAKCFVDANGDESLAKVAYLKLRVQQISDEMVLANRNKLSEVSKTTLDDFEKLNTAEKKNINLTANFSENINYSSYSVRKLFDDGMYKVIEKDKHKFLFFYNGYVGCLNGSLIKVFETETFCKKAIKDNLLSTKYPIGLVATLEIDSK